MPSRSPKQTARVHQILTVAVMAFIFIQSALPGSVSGMDSGFIASVLQRLFGDSFTIPAVVLRKSAHFIEYTVLGVSLMTSFLDRRASRTGESRPLPLSAAAAWLAGTLYAGTDELHQLLVPGRGGSFRDVCLDAAGVLAGVLFRLLVSALIRKTGKPERP